MKVHTVTYSLKGLPACRSAGNELVMHIRDPVGAAVMLLHERRASGVLLPTVSHMLAPDVGIIALFSFTPQGPTASSLIGRKVRLMASCARQHS